MLPDNMSYADARNLIEGHLNEGKTDDDSWIWVKDLFDDKVVYEDDGTLYQATYTLTDGVVTLGTPERVKTTYEKFAELQDVEVLRVGTFTSMDGTKVTFTEADLLEILNNFNEIPNNRIPAVVGHADGDDSELINVIAVGAPVIAYMESLKQVVEGGIPRLKANFGAMAEKAVDMIGKTLVRISPEVFTNFCDNEGTAHGKAFKRISFIGRSAIRELPDVTEANIAFGDDPSQETMVLDLSEAGPSVVKHNEGGKDTMELVIKDKADLIKLAETNSVIKEMLDNQAKLEEAIKTSATKLSEHEKEVHKKSITDFLDQLGEAGKLSPAMRPSVQIFMESLSHGSEAVAIKFGESGQEAEKDPLGYFMEVLSAKDLLITFGETEPVVNKDILDGNTEALIQKYKEDHPDIGYTRAAIEVSREHPELFK